MPTLPIITNQAELVTAYAQALDQTLVRWDFVWVPTNGGGIKEQIDPVTAQALVQARLGSPYFQSSSWHWTTSWKPSGTHVTVAVQYRFAPDDLKAKVQEADAKAASVVAAVITNSMGDYEKELALHDWLVTHAVYDLANYQADTVPPEEYTPFGVLVKGTGVCESYATAFRLLADKAGLESRMVSGRGNGQSHAWNQVRVDEKWYNLDVTWDDPPGARRLSHTYFNIDDQALATQHGWDRATAPACNDTAANWFVRQGLVSTDVTAFETDARVAVQKHQDTLVRRLLNFDPEHFQSALGAALKRAIVANQANVSMTIHSEPSQGVVEVQFHYF